jgi:perosamine synthetase
MEYRIPIAAPSIGNRELELVTEVVKSGMISSKGRFVNEFETGFARYTGVKNGVAVSNGTVALHLAITALGIGSGDEVIIPDLTFAAVANAVLYSGAKPVFADSNAAYWCVDPSEIEKKITNRTKAIILVHLYGHPCDMKEIMDIANENDLYVIEDCAEAHGAEYRCQKVGSFGDISCFSFFGNKIITTGEGGMCLTNDDQLSENMKILRDHGMSAKKRYWHEVIGFNYRMTNLQAAIGIAQLERINEFISRKRDIANAYKSSLKGTKGLTLHPEMTWAKNVYWMYSILVNKREFGMDREELMNKLAEKGIETRPFFYPIHEMPPYIKYKSGESFGVASELSSVGVSLPSGNCLSDLEIGEVCKLILKNAHAT